MKPADRPLLICLTGSIASGKSLAVQWFQDHKYRVVSADRIAHELLQDKDIVRKLQERHGETIFGEKGIDRNKLGRIIFADKQEREFLNGLLHPLILKTMQDIIDHSTDHCLIFEIPLLFEKGLEKSFDLVINITADPSIRKHRIKTRDSLSDEQIDLRMQSQMTDKIKTEKADINIDNTGTIDELLARLAEVDSKYIKYLKPRKIKKMTDK